MQREAAAPPKGAFDLLTPEGVELRFALAPLFSRAVALFLDLLLVTGATVVIGIASWALLPGASGWAVSLIGIFVIRHGYFAWFETHFNGATPGKLALGIRVISRDGGRLTMPAVLARNLMRDVEMFLPLVAIFAPDQLIGQSPGWMTLPALGWVAIHALLPLTTRERTRSGDLVGGTVVISVPSPRLLDDTAARVTAPHLAVGAAQQPLVFSSHQLSYYGEHELETLVTLLRQADWGQASAYDLAVIAATIARKVEYLGPEAATNPERFLRAFYKQQRAALEKKLLLGKRKASKYDQ